MVYSTSDRVSEQLAESRVARSGRGVVVFDGKRFLVGSQGATLGRSRDCDVVLDDPNVSRHHAEVRPSGGSWIVNDLGSTNGIKVNDRRVDRSRLSPGDEVTLGTTRFVFDIEQ